MEIFEFGGYVLRPARFSDLELARVWTEADPDHAGRVKPLFWINQEMRSQSYLLIDSEGPLFFFKGIWLADDKTMEIHIQFPPYEQHPQTRNRLRHRVSQGLTEGMQWLEQRLTARGATEIVFDSSTRPLIRFAEKRLGFRLEHGRLRKRLAKQGEMIGA